MMLWATRKLKTVLDLGISILQNRLSIASTPMVKKFPNKKIKKLSMVHQITRKLGTN